MSDILTTRVNDDVFSSNSVDYKFAGLPLIGITSFEFTEKRERKLVYGARKDGRPIGITSGKYSLEGLTVAMLPATFLILTTFLTPLGLGSYGDAKFPITVTLSEPLSAQPPICLLFDRARITGRKQTQQEGIDEILTQVDMMALSHDMNGLALYSRVKGIGQ